jgi:hypothetical protein
VVGGFLCTAPGEVISALIIWGITGAGYFVHRKLLAREAAAAADPSRRGEAVRG